MSGSLDAGNILLYFPKDDCSAPGGRISSTLLSIHLGTFALFLPNCKTLFSTGTPIFRLRLLKFHDYEAATLAQDSILERGLPDRASRLPRSEFLQKPSPGWPWRPKKRKEPPPDVVPKPKPTRGRRETSPKAEFENAGNRRTLGVIGANLLKQLYIF